MTPHDTPEIDRLQKDIREREGHRRAHLRTAKRARARGADRVARRHLKDAQHEGGVIRRRRNTIQDIRRRGHGSVQITSYANRPGVIVDHDAVAFFKAVAAKADEQIICTTGTNHNKYTTSGSISDHWSGQAGDFGIGANGDCTNIAAAALMVCGWSKSAAWAAARRGGLFNCTWKGHRVQIIWRTYIGGNHYNHIHLGCR